MKFEEFKKLLEEELKTLNASDSEIVFITKEAESHYVNNYDVDVYVYAKNALKYTRNRNR